MLKEKCGFVLIDFVFEWVDEYVVMINVVIKGWCKWFGGICVLWYFMKDKIVIWCMYDSFREVGFRDVFVVEFNVGKSGLDIRMFGFGMILINLLYILLVELCMFLLWFCDVLY